MSEREIFDPNILSVIEEQLVQTLASSQENIPGIKHIYEAMRYSALAGGKRLRPYLTVAAGDIFGVPRARAARAGAAIELIHCYSLIHDDLPAMDDSDLRRGRPTSHIAFDVATAILAGDGLLTEAFHVLSAEETHPAAEVRIELVRALSEAAGSLGMVGGQMIDILAENGQTPEADIELLQALKTGALIRVSCRFGGLLAQASESDLAALDLYASHIGLAFQITDDLLDVTGTTEATGKQVGLDAANDKPTFVELLGQEGAEEKAATLIADARAALEPFGEKGESLRVIADFILKRDR